IFASLRMVQYCHARLHSELRSANKRGKPMTLIRLFGAAALLSLSSLASASSFIGTTDMIGSALVGTSESTTNLTSGDDKVVLAAREDAASFVASAGEIRGAQLESALQLIRAKAPALQVTDLELAEAILAR